MFLPKDFLDGPADDPVAATNLSGSIDGPPASASSTTFGDNSTSRPASSSFGGGTYGSSLYGNSSSSASAALRPASSSGRPLTAGSMGAEDEADDTATPMSAASLRQKMLQQRQRALQKQRIGGLSASSSNMVMANESLPSGEASAARTPTAGQSGSPAGRPCFGRTFSASAVGSPMVGFNPEGDHFRQPLLDNGRPYRAGNSPMPPTLESSLSSMSLGEDASSLIIPEMYVDSKEEEARRRSSLAQELDERGICPVYDPTPATGKESTFDISSISPLEMKGFLLNPAPKHAGMVECRIIRERGGLNKLFPKYTVESDSGVFLMTAKKQKHNKTSNYAISMSKNDAVKDSDSFLGKLRSNFLGLEFISYGTGLNPKKIDPTMSQVHAIQLARQEMVAIQYSSSLWGTKPRGPRKMSAVIPRVQPSGERLVCRTLHPDSEGLLAMHKNGTSSSHMIDCYQNKPPKWNEQIGAFVLNFNKRVTQASVKNFQLTSTEDPDTVYLQFGRVGKDVFNMDFRHPFSPFQAFAICLSSFDYKLCCE
mmetsp:Transcript_53397/g.97627  ORF Transcript_53397/g.97627 Transcript_53397/m.97627 type:complete len:539 (-) Transcript_53397:82-1698(-)